MKKRKLLKSFLKTFFILTGILLLISVFIFTPVNRNHYKDQAYYQKMKTVLDSIPQSSDSNSIFRAGWSKVNITPNTPVSIASYGLRDNFDKVHDSLWCRAFVFENGNSKSALVTVDLLIFPPMIVKKLKGELPKIGFSLNNTFFSASHSHNAAGGWAEGLGGRLLAGKYDEEYVQQLTDAVIASIKAASENLDYASIGFAKYQAKEFIYNRLNEDENTIDSWLRVIRIQKHSGNSAAIVTYAAHPNVLSSKYNGISGDYASALVDSLENFKGIDFAAFCAGAVAGHTCNTYKERNFVFIKRYASYLSGIITNNFQNIILKDSIKIRSLSVPLYLQEVQVKVSKDIAIRPWLFNLLLGKQNVYLSALQLGDVVLMGTPCDFAGELVKEISSSNKKDLVVTSFNGGYIGYIVPDKYYDLPSRESRDMSWHGPYNASYFLEIMNSVLRKL